MSRFTVILNPAAGKGAGRKLRTRIIGTLRLHTSDFEIVETTKRGDATALARESISPVVVAIGGDGTIHEVANGILGSDRILGIVPIGSGNDFIKSVGVPKGLDQSIATLTSGRKFLIDVGKVEVTSDALDADGEGRARYFVNGLGIGFDAAVAVKTHDIRFASGTLSYVISVLQTLGSYTAPTFTSAVDGERSTSKNLLIAIGNGKCAGGGFYLTPEARVDDGILDVCLIKAMSVFEILRLMPKVMRGAHTALPKVRVARATSIEVTATRPVAVHTDGEILGERIASVKITVVPGFLNVLVPS